MSGSSRVLWPMVILLRISQKGNESSSLCLSLHLCLFPQTKHIGFPVQPHRTTHTCQAMPYFLLYKVLHNLFPLPGIPTLTFLFHLVRLLTIFQTCQSYSHLRAFALAILSAWNVLSPHLHVATPSFHCLHFNPTSWSTLSVPSTQRPPGTYLQWSELGLLLVAMKENTHHGELWDSQYEDGRKDLQHLGSFLSRSIMVTEWLCLMLMFCEIVYIQQENTTA